MGNGIRVRDLPSPIINSGVGYRDQFYSWEWYTLKEDFAAFYVWKYRRRYIWSYPETAYGLTNAAMWNNLTGILREGKWSSKR